MVSRRVKPNVSPLSIPATVHRMPDGLSSPAAAVAAKGAASSAGAAEADQSSNPTFEANERDKRRLVSKAQKLAKEARANSDPAAMSPILLQWAYAGSANAHQDAQLWVELKQACEIFYKACAGTGLEDAGDSLDRRHAPSGSGRISFRQRT